MKFNIWFTFRGPAGEIEAPNTKNPVEHTNLASLLAELANNLPHAFGLNPVGIRIENQKE